LDFSSAFCNMDELLSSPPGLPPPGAEEIVHDFFETPTGCPASVTKVLLTIPCSHLNHGARWLRRAKNRRQLWQWFQDNGVAGHKDDNGTASFFVCFNTWKGTPGEFGRQLAWALNIPERAGIVLDERWYSEPDQTLVSWSFTQGEEPGADVFLLCPRGVVVVQGVPAMAQGLHEACKIVLRAGGEPVATPPTTASESDGSVSGIPGLVDACK